MDTDASSTQLSYRPRKLDIYFLGMTLVISGQYFSWNIGLAAGLYSYLVVYFVMGTAYICFCLCMAEVTGALPFAGGAYGLARCTLGFFPAFIIGMCETLEYIASVAVIANGIADLTIQMVPTWIGYQPVMWALFYISSTGFQLVGGGAFWIPSMILGVASLVILIVYCIGCLWFVDWRANAVSDPTQLYTNGLDGVLSVLPFSAWFFLGIEALNLASDDVQAPKTEIPTAQVACICTLFGTGLFVLLATVALPTVGGVAAVAGALAPLSNGFIMMLGVNAAGATALTLPAQYGAAYGLSWAHTKLIHGMAESKLLPPWLATTSSRFKTPHYALIVGALIGYGICLAVYWYPPIVPYLLPLCLLFAFASYSGQCIGYISLKWHYPIVNQSAFKNPLGIAAAVYSLLVWMVSMIGIVGFQGHHALELAVFAVLIVLVGLYYWAWARKRQTMSEEESKILLVAHIMRFNNTRKIKPQKHTTSKPTTLHNNTSAHSEKTYDNVVVQSTAPKRS